MSRVINPNPPGKERNRLKRAVALALRELSKESEASDKARDLAAFIALSLEAIEETVDTAAVAWEKRGYWIKADRFRREWIWAQRLGVEMRHAALSNDWDRVPSIAIELSQRLGDVKVSERHRMGTPWVGSWEHLQNSKS